MLDGNQWVDEYPTQLSKSEQAVAQQALFDGYLKGFEDAKKKRSFMFVGNGAKTPKELEMM